jgi:hypothetical protein
MLGCQKMINVDNWVSAEFQRLAQVVYDYDQYLEFQMVPLDQQMHLTDKSQVFRIVDTRNNRVVLYADSLSNPQEILTRLFCMDQDKGNVVARMDAQNAAAEALRNEKIIEEREAFKDLAAFIGKNTKSRWHHNGRVRDDQYNDLGPVKKIIL